MNVWGGPSSRIRTRSPTWKWYLDAVPASTTTWWAVVGAEPWRSLRADSVGLGSNEVPMVGAPPVVTALPSGATNCAYPETDPLAATTPGTARTVAATDWGIGLRTAPSLPVKAAVPRTTKLTFW